MAEVPPPAEMGELLPLVPVVGPQFCAPYVVALTVTEKVITLTDGDFIVTDVNGTVLMKVKDKLLSLHDRRELCDADGTPIITMKEKKLSMHDRWYVYRGSGGDDESESDVLFTVRKSHVLHLRTELEVFLAGNTEEEQCDFRVKGSWFERACTIYLGETDTVVASMSKEYEMKNVLVGKDAFGVTVYPNVDYAFVVALIVILDAINSD